MAISKSGAEISDDGKYRYTLWRIWNNGPGKNGELVNFIGLNPSTADGTEDDPTIQRLCGYAGRWGYGGIVVTNLFAFRARDPRQMMAAGDPVGPENDEWIRSVACGACIGPVAMIVCCWGHAGGYMGRGDEVKKELSKTSKPHCFGLTKEGHPRHPLYLKGDFKPKVFK